MSEQNEIDVVALINLWPQRRDLADDIGVEEATVHKWAQNGSIRSKYLLRIYEAAMRRGYDVSPIGILRALDKGKAA